MDCSSVKGVMTSTRDTALLKATKIAGSRETCRVKSESVMVKLSVEVIKKAV